ncbi:MULTISPECIES: DedA family protein [Paenibacillus]|uniref:DedA family protein n=1 Tax=Paenibacillus TaxID=44249 RepID=UPI0008387A48|nr:MULTISPECIES: DedA family protein [Paenibacillus]
MDFLKYLETLFESHGYWVLFIGLVLEFIALPFPGETTMAYAGYLSYKGLLAWPLLIVIAFLGTTIGITITYWIGRKAGFPFIKRYGKWFLLPPKKLDTARYWFEKYGYTLIFIGYFIPGVRHITGYFSGIISLPFRKFAIYAYSGALFWTALFIGIGRIFGPQWSKMFHLAATYSAAAGIALVIIILAVALFRYRRSIKEFMIRRFSKSKNKSETSEIE